MEKVGPFVERQISIGFVICMLFLLYALFCILKYHKKYNWLLCLLVMDSFILFQYDLWLKTLDSPQTIILALIDTTVQTVCIGALGIVCSMLMSHYFKKKAQSI